METPESKHSFQSVSARLGVEVRQLRRAAGLTQKALADRVHYSRSYIALIETGRECPSAEALDRIGSVLHDCGSLRALHRATAASDHSPELDMGQSSHNREQLVLSNSAMLSDAVVTLVPFDSHASSLGLQRTLAVSVHGGRRYAIDAMELSRRPRERVPPAYELDDFTYAILCAVATLDDALLADDASLAEARASVVDYEQLRGSAVSRDIVHELQRVSQMWLGSYFCARHISRNVESFTDTPVFWTAEKRGEESANWLLFAHKHKYLAQVRQRFGRTTRIFCIPEEAVRVSPRHERILLFLSIALMESMSIAVQITSDSAYGSISGFVLTPSRRALVANWLRADGVWHVDNTTSRAVVSELKEVAGYGAAHSIVDAPGSEQRLHALAAYLGLDWGWLVRRADELAVEGVRPLAKPRSRLLSTWGIDTACAYIGTFSPTAQAASA